MKICNLPPPGIEPRTSWLKDKCTSVSAKIGAPRQVYFMNELILCDNKSNVCHPPNFSMSFNSVTGKDIHHYTII